MARAAYDHARHGVFELRPVVSDLFHPCCPDMTLIGPCRKYESGGLGLNAGDFSQLSGSMIIRATVNSTNRDAQLR